MNDRELERLMNDQLDGVATSEDSERLSRALESREDVRTEYRKLGGVFAALSCVEMEEPPSDLKQNILRSIRKAETAPAREGWLESIAAAFRGRPGFRSAYSFASGAVLGVLAFALLSGNLLPPPGSDPRPFKGPMIPPPDAAAYQRISSRYFPFRAGPARAQTL